jgi:hypothetical protein
MYKNRIQEGNNMYKNRIQFVWLDEFNYEDYLIYFNNKPIELRKDERGVKYLPDSQIHYIIRNYLKENNIIMDEVVLDYEVRYSISDPEDFFKQHNKLVSLQDLVEEQDKNKLNADICFVCHHYCQIAIYLNGEYYKYIDADECWWDDNYSDVLCATVNKILKPSKRIGLDIFFNKDICECMSHDELKEIVEKRLLTEEYWK